MLPLNMPLLLLSTLPGSNLHTHINLMVLFQMQNQTIHNAIHAPKMQHKSRTATDDYFHYQRGG